MRYPDILLRREISIREALTRIDVAGTQMALVVDADCRLLGTVSDGDIRRGLLAGHGLDDSIGHCLNPAPATLRDGTSDAEILETLQRHGLHQIPIIDAVGRVVDLRLLDELIRASRRPNAVALMVGGLGSRLGELTANTPKPMLNVGGRPLLEHIVADFVAQGFHRFWFAVNYRAEIIERYFEDGHRHGCEIAYLREEQRLGTAGALSLLPSIPDEPIVVSNGDLLTRTDVGALLDFHIQTGADATMAVREYEMQVPYGVVRAEGVELRGVEEKPIHRHLIAGGMYVLSASALRRIPVSQFYDMPMLFDSVAQGGGRAHVFPIDGYWLDIGHQSDYQRAQNDFPHLSGRHET